MDREVCVLIPTFNEAATIGSVIDGFREQGYPNVLVVDGRSDDETQAVAEEHGARVIEQRRYGKGQAVREAIEYIEEPYVLLLDGDGTYDPTDADRMLEPLIDGRAEHVIGSRFERMDEGAMDRLNRFGNRIINSGFSIIHGRDFGDILSGYRAFTRDSLDQFALDSEGFTIETELAVACVKHRVPTAVVPVSYHPRPNGSETNLSPIRDGGRILHALYSLARMNNPLFYFGLVGVISILSGLAIGGFVGFDWYVNHISHEALAVVSAFAILLGVQLFMFGVLSDMVIAVNREHTRQLETVTDHLTELQTDTSERENESEQEQATTKDEEQLSKSD